MSNQAFFGNGEADEWFLRNKEALEQGKSDKAVELLADWLEPFKADINSILEVGCGSGHILNELSTKLEAAGTGIEPGAKAVEYIQQRFPSLKAAVGFGNDIPLDEQFDLVHLGFFLYLVDRDKYLRCVSEADRLLKPGGFLSIIDFDTPVPYSNEYSHQAGVYSHKTNNSSVFVASGLYSVVNKYHYSHQGFHFDRDINERVSLTLLYKEKSIFKGV